MSIIGSNILAGASGQAGGGGAYEIQRSLRFNALDSSFLSRTPGSASNRKTWTWAGWVKLSSVATSRQLIFNAQNGTSTGLSNNFWIFYYVNVLGIGDGLTNYLYTANSLKDTSAWYHIVCACDTTQATAANRFKFYINGVEATYGTDNRSSLTQNADTAVNSTFAHKIGDAGNSIGYLNSYLADVHFIDGQALDPSSFGEFDTNGVWQPIDASGLTYGTNGFHLPFSDNSTAAALGTDTSGNGNTWTVNNISPGVATGSYVANTTISTGGYTNPLLNGFDGNTSTATEGDTTSSVITVPISSTISTGGVRVYAAVTASNPLVVNIKNGGTTVETFTGNISGGRWYASSTYSGTITALEISRTGRAAEFNAIEVNGTVLIDYGADAGNDSLRDSPTNGSQVDTGVGGEVVGNYATLNPLNRNPNANLANGNLDLSLAGAGTNYGAFSTFGVRTGKWYFEAAINSFITYGITTGFVTSDWGKDYIGTSATAYFGLDTTVGRRSSAGITASGTTVTFGAGDIVGVAFNADAGTATIYKNGASIYTFSGIPANEYFPALSSGGSSAWVNFGQRQWAYAAPAGFKALCTTNLPEPTIADGSTVMDVALYTGDGNSTRTISGLGFAPDLVWIKSRTTTAWHTITDIVRGTNKTLSSNDTSAEFSTNNQGWLSQFNSDGFTVVAGAGGAGDVNGSSIPYVAWTWDAGSSTVTNTQGSITSQVRANASAGFSVVTYTGTGANATVGHGLGVQPGLVIVKKRDAGSSFWAVWHSSLLGTQVLLLQDSLAAQTVTLYWNSLTPTSSVINLGASTHTNGSANTFVAYCFAPVAGYSAFGRYTGNGSADGPMVWTGFRPRWVMTKASSSTGLWNLHDTTRSNSNPASKLLWADSSSNEVDYAGGAFTIDCLSNGFKARAATASLNSSGVTYIYAAFAEHPFKTARAR